jgi:oxygen tolerance protein BatD
VRRAPAARTLVGTLVAAGALVSIGAVAPAATLQQGSPRVECELERAQCYEGESVEYVVAVRDVEDAAAPELKALADDFTVESRGSRSLNSSSIHLDSNGRMVRDVQYGTDFHFLLTPKRTGRITIPGPNVTAGGKTLEGNALALEVVSPDSQDLAYLAVEVAPAEVYPLEPFTIRLRLFVKRLPAEARGGDETDPLGPLCRNSQPIVPMLKVPWADLPDTFAGESANDWLKPKVAKARRGERGVGFGINEYAPLGAAEFPFDDFFGGPRVAIFDLGGHPATAADVAAVPALAGKAGDYFAYLLERTAKARRLGTYAFGPATLKGPLIDGFNRRDRKLSVKSVFAVGRAVHLIVKDAPAAGRPRSFGGGFGRFEIAAAVAPTRAHVGDPLTLTLSVTGDGNLEELAPPDLTALPEFVRSFKIYEATAETKGGARTFTYSLRPLAATVKEVPPVPFAWFDVVRGKFVETQTKAIPLEVIEAEKLDSSAIVAKGGGDLKHGSDLAARTEGLFTHDTDPRALGDERVDWRVPASTALALPCVTIAAAALASALRRRGADARAKRLRGAPGRARARVATADETARRGDSRAAALELRGALVGLVADFADLPEAGLTAREADEQLRQAGVDAPLAARVRAALDALEAAQYGGAAELAPSALGDGKELVAETIEALSRRGRRS